MVYPPQDYVSSTCPNTGREYSEFDQECREFTDKDQLNKLVAELNDANCPLPILCEHEANTVAGHVKCAKMTPGKGILVTMRLDTSTEHGYHAASKVASGDWAYVSLGHEFVATRGNNGYDIIKKTAMEVSCCALGARNQTAVIERLDESRWKQHASRSGVVLSSAKAADIGIDAPGERHSFRSVLIGDIVASSVSKSLPVEGTGVHTEDTDGATAKVMTEHNPQIQTNDQVNSSNTEAPTAPAVGDGAGDAATAAAADQEAPSDAQVAPPTEGSPATVNEAAPPSGSDHTNNQDDVLHTLTKARCELDLQQKTIEGQDETIKELQAKINKQQEIESRRKVEERERYNKEVAQKREELERRLSAVTQSNQQVSMVKASAILSDKMDIDQSECIVSALEKATEGYIAASDSKKQLQQQLTDMSSAVGIVDDAHRDAITVAPGGVGAAANKRKAEDIVDPAALAAQGTVNASSVPPANGLPLHTSDFMAGTISYTDLSRACEAQRDAESGMRVRQLTGSVNASADVTANAPSIGLGITGGFSASAHTAYSQYCNPNARRLLPAASDMRQDCRGMGLKQFLPGIWDEFMQINNSFEKTGVPNYVKGAICSSINSYEHKRRNGESRLDLNDTMPPPPGGTVRPRQMRTVEH